MRTHLGWAPCSPQKKIASCSSRYEHSATVRGIVAAAITVEVAVVCVEGGMLVRCLFVGEGSLTPKTGKEVQQLLRRQGHCHQRG